MSSAVEHPTSAHVRGMSIHTAPIAPLTTASGHRSRRGDVVILHRIEHTDANGWPVPPTTPGASPVETFAVARVIFVTGEGAISVRVSVMPGLFGWGRKRQVFPGETVHALPDGVDPKRLVQVFRAQSDGVLTPPVDTEAMHRVLVEARA